ncbi:MAG: DNA polymerase III subunit alpha [Burkholderiales bacterium]
MSSPQFIHLRVHSEYSISDGMVRIDDAVDAAVAERMPAVAVTDLSNLFGVVKFYKAARAKGLKPIIGADVWISNDANREQASRLLLLCRNHDGYLALCELLSRAYRENQFRGRAEIRRDWLDEKSCAGLIALSGGEQGDIGQALRQDNLDQAKKCAGHWASVFPQRFYIELQRAGSSHHDQYVVNAAQLATTLNIPAVATHPVQFLHADDFRAHEARVCVAQGHILGDQRRKKEFTGEQYFKTQEEMAKLFADFPEALQNSVEIAKRCNLELTLNKVRLPLFPTPENISLDDYMRQQSRIGLEQRLAQLFPDAAFREQKRAQYAQRLEFEADTIVHMGFSGYFLIVADFINWAKKNNVPVGPGRGSGAGSLIAYFLGITDLDPLRYDLLFERFLNPERVSMPDFDVDFCQEGRGRVIDYVKQKYGADSVSQIVTFGTMAAKAVVRDVGRVLDLPYNFVDSIAKLIPFEIGMTLKKAREVEPQLNERIAKEEEVRQLFELAEKLEGMTRNVGMHAGGVLIAPGKLTDFTPLYMAEGSEDAVSQLDKDDVEAIGLVKFDFLGLTTLTILARAMKYIHALHPEQKDLRLETLPLADEPTFQEIFAKGNTVAVFQFESSGMIDLLRRARPDRFEDIIALVALYRPGPMELIPNYVEQKKTPSKISYPDPRLEPILAPTYGIMIYQEQVMQAAQVIGGFSLGGADLLRRAMGKKNASEMAAQRALFVLGAGRNGIPEGRANLLFDVMEKFAGYGFNKSHAAAYALVAYQTAYLKAHFVSCFMAATMSAVMDDTDKVKIFHDDCVNNKIKILPPDINQSNYRFEPVDDISIRYGLGAIKGTGQSAVESIACARAEGGPFKDIFDFCRRSDKRLVNKRTVESLIRAGAFDNINPHRASLLASAGAAMEAAEQAAAHANQVSLFGDATEENSEGASLANVPEWNEREKLQNEKLALGYYFSGHPFNHFKDVVRGFAKTGLAQAKPGERAQYGGERSFAKAPTQWFAGIIMGTRVRNAKNGRGRMAILTLSDDTAQREIVLYDKTFEQSRPLLQDDGLIIIEARVENSQFRSDEGGAADTIRIIAENIYDLASARARFAKKLQLNFNGQANAKKLGELLTPYLGGDCPVGISYHNGTAACDLDLPDSKRVRLSDALIQSLSEWVGAENVNVLY